MAKRKPGAGQTALVTGASGGIGEALAVEFAKAGYDLVLVARSADKLELLAEKLTLAHKVTAHALPEDLGEAEGAARLCAKLDELGLSVDVLVNNAGYGLRGEVLSLPREDQLAMIDLNVRMLSDLTMRLAPAMVQRGRGGIMNIASTASFQPGPYLAVYYATKAYVLSFSEALNQELRGTGVHVTAVCPGPTVTGFQERADLDGAKLLSLIPLMTAEQVARSGYRAFKAKKPVHITGLVNFLMAKSVAFTPRFLLMPLIRYLQK